MKLTNEQMRALWQSAETSATVTAGCPPAEFWLRAEKDELQESELTFLRTHLETCATCAETYVVARATADWVAQATPLLSPQPQSSADKTSFLSFRGWRWPWQTAFALLFMLICFCLSVWVYRLRQDRQALEAQATQQQKQLSQTQAQLDALAAQDAQNKQTLAAENNRLQNQLAQLTQPQLEIPIIDADPASLSRGDDQSKITRVELAPETAAFTIIFHLNQTTSAKTLLLEWRNAQGQTLWQRELTPPQHPNITVLLSRQQVPAGKYHVRVLALPEQRRPLEQYELEIVYQTKRRP